MSELTPLQQALLTNAKQTQMRVEVYSPPAEQQELELNTPEEPIN